MLRYALSVIGLAILPALAAAAPKDMKVYGRAPVGAFGVDTLEHVEGAAKLGMTLLYSYSPQVARKQLDPNDPTGKALGEELMLRIVRHCEKVGAYLISDEVYLGAEISHLGLEGFIRLWMGGRPGYLSEGLRRIAMELDGILSMGDGNPVQ